MSEERIPAFDTESSRKLASSFGAIKSTKASGPMSAAELWQDFYGDAYRIALRLSLACDEIERLRNELALETSI